ncbi:MAG: extracellular solute-binding protein [Ruminococcaceae bacterium]|nr:extracellular solute-binding protein [Oscillospiraceae bacterium]
MKTKKMKRLTAVALAMLMLALAGCTDKSATRNEKVVAKRNDPAMYNEPGTYPILKEKKTLSIMTPSNALVENFETSHYTKMLEEKGGVDLEFVLLPATDGASKFSVMVASQTELPDILCAIPGDFTSFIYSGLVVPVQDYYADPDASYHFHQAVSDEKLRDELLANTRMADGNNYGIMRYSKEPWNEYSYRGWINQTWLDKLGLPMPETTEDFYNTLVAFKENDLNGNGKKDEIPLMGSTDGWNQNPIPFLMNAFIYADAKNNYMFIEDGKIDVAFNKPEWKEGLKYINKLVKEGLLSPLTFTQNQSQFKTILEDPDKQVMGSMMAGSLTVYSSTEHPNRADMQPMKPLKGPKGACYATYNPSVPVDMTYISKYCDDPETAFRVMEYCFSEEMSISGRYGKRGEHWDYLNEKESNSLGADFLGRKPAFKELKLIWGNPQTAHWQNLNPGIMGVKNIVLPAPTDMTAAAVPLYMDKHPEEIIARIVHTTDELTDIADIETSIKSYVSECMTRFVLGDMSFDEWDDYVKELDKMGLEDYLRIKQAAYDRVKDVK